MTLVDQTLARQQAHLNVCYVDGLTEVIKRRVLSGSGSGWLPHSAIQTELADCTVQQLGASLFEAKMELSVFCSPTRLSDKDHEVWARFGS